MARINKRGKRFIKAIIILVIIIIGVLFILKGENKITKKGKILLIGIDGMDYKVTEKLIEDGKLPNFKKLAKTGSFKPLQTSYPPESPVAWTSISTGTNPGQHNMFDFIIRDPKTYTPELSITKQSGLGGKYVSLVKATPFWDITSKAGIPTSIIRWPATFPPDKVNGNLLSGLGVPDIKGFLSGYTYYSESVQNKDKTIRIIKDEKIVKTYVSGPKVRKINRIEDIKEDMIIEIINSTDARLTVNENSYNIKEKEWSEWIKVKFNAGFLKNVDGIFKTYLISTDPFEMYITTVQIDPTNPVVDISSPDSFAKELAEEIGLYYTLGIPEETDGIIDGWLDEKAFLEQIYEIESEREKMFWKEFNEFKEKDSAVLAVTFDSSDRLQHIFWDDKVLSKNTTEILVNEAVVDYYVRKDEMLGKVLEQIDNDTLLLVFSDHGFTSFERAVNINTWLVENDFMTLTKKIQDNDEAPLFQNVDWETTDAYSVGFASIYLNLKGREAQGTVEDRDIALNEIITKLENLTDPKTGKKVVHKAYRREDIYSGDYVKNAPDIIIGFNPGYRMSWQSAIGGFTKEIVFDNNKKWQGDHLIDPSFVPGVIFSNRILSNHLISLQDIAPKVLSFFGLENGKK